jgi:hypothetical protein
MTRNSDTPNPVPSKKKFILNSQSGHWLAVVIIFLFTLIFFKEAVFQGKLLSPIDAACPIDSAWHEVCGDISIAQNALIGSDQAAQFYPWRIFVRDSLRHGVLPLWNPYNAGGYPMLANAQSSVFYPINLLADLFPVNYMFTVGAVLRIFITGLGTYLLARQLKISIYGAMLAAIAFAFSGPVIVWQGYAIIEVMVFFPLLLYFTEKVFQSKNLFFTLAVGVTFGLMGIAGHPQTLLMSVIIWGLYLLFRLVVLNRAGDYSLKQLGIIVIKLGGASLLGIGLAAVQLLPTWQMAQESIGYVDRGLATNPGLFEGNIQKGSLFSLILLIWPGYFGNPSWPEVAAGVWFMYKNFNPLALYIGFLPLLFLPFIFLVKQQRWIVWVYGGIVLVSTGFFLSLPVFHFIAELGLMEKILIDRFRLFAAFGLAILAGLGLDVFLTFRRKSLYAGIVFGCTLLLTLTVGQIGFKLVNHPFAHQISGFNFTISQIDEAANQLDLPPLNSLWGNPSLTFGIPLAMAGMLWLLVVLFKNRPKYLASTLLLLIAFDMYAVNARFNVTNDAELEFQNLVQKSQTLTFLQQTMQPTDRMVALGPTFLPNSATLLGISDARGYDTMMSARYYKLFEAGPGYHQYGPGGFFLTQLPPALQILSTNYILSPSPLPNMPHVFVSDGGLFVYHLPNALPRAYLVKDVQVLADQEIFDAVVKGTFDPAATALIETEPPDWWTHSDPDALSSASVQIIDYQSNQVTLEVDSPTLSFLVLADGYDAGWNVYVDGEGQPLYRTNYVVRGVFLPEGHQLVEFVYEPMTFKVGAVITLISIAVVLIGGVAVWRRRYVSSPAEPSTPAPA